MPVILRKNKKLLIGGIIAIIIALAIRLLNLTVIPVFADEAIYIRWSQVMRAEQNLRFLPLSDGKQPLFMWATIPFLKLFSDPLIAGRIVSVLCGLGTLVGIFVLAYILFGSLVVSFFASLIYAISPFPVFFDRLALADSMLSFFGLWTLIFSSLTVRKVRLDTAMFAGFSLGGALLTKSPALYFVLLTPLTLLLSSIPNKFKEKFYKLSIFVFLFTITYIIAFGFYNILRLGPNFHMIAIRNQDYVYPLTHILSSPLDPLKPFLSRIFQYFWILGPWELVLLLIAGVFIGIRKFPKSTVILILCIAVPVIASAEFSKTMTARYVYFSFPYLVILAALSIYGNIKTGGVKLFHSTSGRVFIIVLAVVFIAHSFYSDVVLLTIPQKANLPRSERSGYLEEWTAGYGIKEISVYLKNEYNDRPSEKIIVGTEGYFGTLPDGLQIYLNDLPQITVIGVGQPIRDVSKSLLESKNAGNKTYLVVNNTRFLGDADKLGLKLVAEYPKAVKPDGTTEKLQLYKL